MAFWPERGFPPRSLPAKGSEPSSVVRCGGARAQAKIPLLDGMRLKLQSANLVTALVLRIAVGVAICVAIKRFDRDSAVVNGAWPRPHIFTKRDFMKRAIALLGSIVAL